MTGTTPLVVDTGPLYATGDQLDPHHESCTALLESHPGPLVVPQLVVAEAAYMLQSRLGNDAEANLLADIAEGTLPVEPVHPTDWLRILELVRQYRNLPLGTVDASVVACAERLGVDTIATVDRRDFSVVRPAHVDAFTLLPEPAH